MQPSPSAGALEGSSRDDYLTVTLEELKYVRERLGSSSDLTMSIVQFIILLFAGAIVAAVKDVAVLAAVPIFWSVWLLLALVRDRDTVKYAAYAVELEDLINRRLGYRLLAWESAMADRGDRRVLIYEASYILWGVMDLASWVLGVAALVHVGQMGWAVVLLCCGSAIWVVVLWTVVTRKRDVEEAGCRLVRFKFGSAIEPDSPDGLTTRHPDCEESPTPRVKSFPRWFSRLRARPGTGRPSGAGPAG